MRKLDDRAVCSLGEAYDQSRQVGYTKFTKLKTQWLLSSLYVPGSQTVRRSRQSRSPRREACPERRRGLWEEVDLPPRPPSQVGQLGGHRPPRGPVLPWTTILWLINII